MDHDLQRKRTGRIVDASGPSLSPTSRVSNAHHHERTASTWRTPHSCIRCLFVDRGSHVERANVGTWNVRTWNVRTWNVERAMRTIKRDAPAPSARLIRVFVAYSLTEAAMWNVQTWERGMCPDP